MVLIGVEAYPEKRMVYFILEETDLVQKDWCTFELKEGKGLGKVKFITPIKENPLFSGRRDLKKATFADIQEFEHRQEIEKKAYQVALEKISFRKLPIKLIVTGYPVGSRRITFYYTAKQRVDFRVLVKDLATVFNLRIQMQQVGVRDEPQLLRSCGVCGRTVCCALFLAKRKKKLNSVSLEAARVQNLPLSSSKISGVCGRLRCCLNFEYSTYSALKKKFPQVGQTIQWQNEKVKVVGRNLLKGTVVVETEKGIRKLLQNRDLAKK
jgi:cell fate regulator YaaT (PSP1 superfamily)